MTLQFRAIASTCLILAGGSSLASPTAPTFAEAQLIGEDAARQGDGDAAQLRLGQAIPGFGGMFIKDGAVFAWMKDPANTEPYKAILTAFAARVNPPQPGPPPLVPFSPLDVRLLKGDFTIAELQSYRIALRSEPTNHTLGVDELTNRVFASVATAADAALVSDFAARSAIPKEALTIIVEPNTVELTATLNSNFRPTKGGNVVTGYDVCSQMMNVQLTSMYPGMRGFLTAAHCTNPYGGNGSNTFYQPFAPSQIGVEMADPNFVNWGCPPGKWCRFADVAFVGFSFTPYDGQGIVGQIHQTDAICTLPTVNCSLTVNGTLTVVGSAPAPAIGATVNKIGKTTGWTQGTVTSQCEDRDTGIGTKRLLCSDTYALGVDSGDSGGPAFVVSSGSNILISGIVWGKLSSGQALVIRLNNFQVDSGMPFFTYY